MDLFGESKTIRELNLPSGRGESKEILSKDYKIPAKGLMIVACLDNYFSLEFSKNLASKWLRYENLSTQLYISTPEGVSWKIDEVNEFIIAPSERVALDTNIVIITQGDMMDERSYDKLLKTIEEPISNTIYIMLVKSKLNLKKTIIGRANTIIELESPSKEELRDYNKDLSEEQCERYYQESNKNLLIYKAILEDQEIYLGLLELNGLINREINPAINSREIIAKVELTSRKISKCLVGSNIESKHLNKEILQGLLGRYQEESRRILKEEGAVERVKRRGEALRGFIVGSRFNTPLNLLVYALLAA